MPEGCACDRYQNEADSRFRATESKSAPNLAAFIVGFADTLPQYQSLLAHRAAQLTRARSSAELVVIDQDTDAVVFRRIVRMTMES